MPNFLSSIIDQAQNAVQSSPLANKIPLGHHRPASPGTTGSSSSATHKSSTLAALNHQFRTLRQQYSDSTPYQRMITTSKGIIMDYDNVGRDAKANSKELYMWGQTETEDLRDVTDRLAYFQFVQGSLAASLAEKLDAARHPLKNLRDKEDALAARRNIRNTREQQIAKLELSSGNEKKIHDLEELLKQSDAEDEVLEKEVQLLERKAIKDSEHAKWEAIREYGEKLVILAQASEQVLQVLPPLPPSPTRRYEGTQETAAIRAAVQKALDDWRPGKVDFPAHHAAVDLGRSDTKSFGETHADELSTIGHDDNPVPRPSTPNHPLHDPPVPASVPVPANTQTTSLKPVTSPAEPSPPLQPGSLNPAPAAKLPQVTPTVAETGVPKLAGPDGPGPASGSLLEVKAEHDSRGSTSGNTTGTTSKPYESAEDEKKRLEREEWERLLKQSSSTPVPKFETAEEEKKRFEREEREKFLASGGDTNPTPGSGKPDENGDELPPYKEF
ncbi:hypothetical protein BDM02DRAFT_3112007 [Thelephora ganbajun]|uniref:Uncharacterized protein n=1 Tax=Thelephora ganbajun TaxID=370292 RepID=A0ACB6ZLQ2_THEGA|nr:hypothetical protein BDM02DRAFT_3112007 [Thelephora ganbajun]